MQRCACSHGGDLRVTLFCAATIDGFPTDCAMLGCPDFGRVLCLRDRLDSRAAFLLPAIALVLRFPETLFGGTISREVCLNMVPFRQGSDWRLALRALVSRGESAVAFRDQAGDALRESYCDFLKHDWPKALTPTPY